MDGNNHQELSNLVAIVTGGASGIGEAIAQKLHSLGAQVAVLDLNTSGVSEDYLAVQTDVSDDESVKNAINQVVSHYKQIDIVINNAGIGAQGTVETNSDEEWHKVFDVNVFGMARITRHSLPHLRKSESAAIVNTSSIAATVGIPERVLYSATKGAVLSLTMAMAADHIREGIRVNCVNPGTAETPWVTGLLSKAENPEKELQALAARQPHGRLVQAHEVADAVAYLASPRSKSTTGTYLAVDGGMQTLRLRND